MPFTPDRRTGKTTATVRFKRRTVPRKDFPKIAFLNVETVSGFRAEYKRFVSFHSSADVQETFNFVRRIDFKNNRSRYACLSAAKFNKNKRYYNSPVNVRYFNVELYPNVQASK